MFARGRLAQRNRVGNAFEVGGGDVTHVHVDADVALANGLQLQRLVGLDHHVHGARQELRRGAQALRIDGRLDQVHHDHVVRAQIARHVDGDVAHQAAVVEDHVVHEHRREAPGMAMLARMAVARSPLSSTTMLPVTMSVATAR